MSSLATHQAALKGIGTPPSSIQQGVLREKVRRNLERLYGDYWGGLWRNFYSRSDGVCLIVSYDNFRLKDAGAVREISQVLPSREMCMLVADEPGARFPGDVILIARPDLFRSTRAKRILGEVHRRRRLFHLGRFGFVDVETGMCYWRVRDGAFMREYGVVARGVRENGHVAVMVHGLSWVGTLAAAKCCTDLHYLDAVQDLLAPKLLEAAQQGRDPMTLPYEVLVEVSYETKDQPPEYLDQFDRSTAIEPFVKGTQSPPAEYTGPGGKVLGDSDLMIRPVAALIGPDTPREQHVVVALAEGDCPANAATSVESIQRLVVDGVWLEVAGTSKHNLLLQLWKEGPRSIKELESGIKVRDKVVSYPVPSASTIRGHVNAAASEVGVGRDLVLSAGGKYRLNSLSQPDRAWDHVGLDDATGPAPGLPAKV